MIHDLIFAPGLILIRWWESKWIWTGIRVYMHAKGAKQRKDFARGPKIPLRLVSHLVPYFETLLHRIRIYVILRSDVAELIVAVARFNGPFAVAPARRVKRIWFPPDESAVGTELVGVITAADETYSAVIYAPFQKISVKSTRRGQRCCNYI